MKILVLNCGSSTLKFQLIEIATTGPQRKLARGIVERVGSHATYRFDGEGAARIEAATPVADHDAAVQLVIAWLKRISQLSKIDAVGHRVVHGGERFTSAVLIDDSVIAELERLCEIAPLHNPASLAGIRATRTHLGAAVPMVASFDTSFHHTIPPHAAAYAIPHELAEKHEIRRYGFHGLAHQYDLGRYAELCSKHVEQISGVTLHLGSGCSATAIRNGQSVDTSMGFTPLEGLVMGTRSGDLDPALVSYLARKENATVDAVEGWLNKRSGLLGVSGLSGDMRELIAARDDNAQARLAIDIFCYRARKYLGAYLAVLAGAAEAVIFSGGIGENAPPIRQEILGGMEWCGINLNHSANDNVIGSDGRISSTHSKIDLFVIHTDEEAIIAQDTMRIIGN